MLRSCSVFARAAVFAIAFWGVPALAQTWESTYYRTRLQLGRQEVDAWDGAVSGHFARLADLDGATVSVRAGTGGDPIDYLWVNCIGATRCVKPVLANDWTAPQRVFEARVLHTESAVAVCAIRQALNWLCDGSSRATNRTFTQAPYRLLPLMPKAATECARWVEETVQVGKVDGNGGGAGTPLWVSHAHTLMWLMTKGTPDVFGSSLRVLNSGAYSVWFGLKGKATIEVTPGKANDAEITSAQAGGGSIVPTHDVWVRYCGA